MTVDIIQADSLQIPLADESIDLIVTSPPYWALRSYQDDHGEYDGQIGAEESPFDFLEALWAVTAECQRVLKPSGSMFVELGDKSAGSGSYNNVTLAMKDPRNDDPDRRGRNAPRQYNKNSHVPRKSLMGLPWRYAIGCTDGMAGDPWTLRAELIWDKPNSIPDSAKDRVSRTHNTVFHLTKAPIYFSAIDEIRVPTARDWDSSARNGRMSAGEVPAGQHLGRETLPNGGLMKAEPNPKGSTPPSVWTIASEPLIIPQWAREKFDLPDHFAAFPTELPRRLILGWSPPDSTILDPFGGTGTTALVADSLGRHGVHVDMSAAYCRLAQWRTSESGHGSKVRTRTNRERQGAML